MIERSNIRTNLEVTVPAKAALELINETEPQIAVLPDANYVAAVIKLRGYNDTYLYIARRLDPRVVAQLRETQASVSEYANLESRRLGVQVAFGLMYTVIALIVLLSAVWIGLNFANRLVAPIRRLIGAANVVSTGNLHVQVPVRRSEGDLAQLGETFNKMTQELRTQRDDLVRARDLIDSRRRFTEAVLAGASAGVIGVDARRQHQHPEPLRRAADRPRRSPRSLGQPLSDVVPELAELVDERARRRPAPGAGPGDDQPQRPRAQPVGAGHDRAIGRRRTRLCRHARRHHRSRHRAAHLGLGRRRAPHRA